MTRQPTHRTAYGVCLLFWATWLLLVAHVPAAVGAGPSRATATVYGGAGRVSGSMTVLDTGNGRWMIDCGVFYPEGDEAGPERERRAAERSATLPVEPAAIDAVVITHAHLDHFGRVPLLVDRGFRGPIYLARPTAELAGPMLEMQVRFDRARRRTWTWSKVSLERARASGRSLYVHWRPCPYRGKIAAENRQTAACSAGELAERFAGQEPPVRTYLCPSCSKEEVAAIRRQFRPLDYGRPREIAPGVVVTLLGAGHIPGSASVLFEISLPGGRRRVLFSGDLGSELSALFAGPRPAPEADVVFLEATYGTTRRDAKVAGERAAFRQAVGEAVGSGGIAWVPAFALDRTQKVFYELHLAQQEGRLSRDVPIYCPSPSARAITEIYREHRRAGWFREEVAADARAWQPGEVRKTVPRQLPRPSILVSPNDMATAEWSERLMESLLPEASTWVLLVGYQDALSEGGKLKQGARQLEVAGRRVHVRARVRSFDCFSGHGDAADLDRWLAGVRRDARIVLVHGGREELRARAAELNAAGRKAVVAVAGEGMELGQ